MSRAGLRTRQNGAAIRALRRKDGQSVSDFAEATGLYVQALRNIENGSRQASWETLNRIANALCVPVAAIVRDLPPENMAGAATSDEAA